MKRHRVFGAALAGVSACAMMLTGAPAMAADATPSWAVNSVFADGLSAFYQDAKDNRSRWCKLSDASQCVLREPKDLGVIQMGESYSGQYVPNGYLTAHDYDIEENPDYGLTVQTYKAMLQPGHYGYFEVSNVAGMDCPAPFAVAVRGESTTADGKSEELVRHGYLGFESGAYVSGKTQQSYADWLLARDTSRDYPGSTEVYKNGDYALLPHIANYGGVGSAGGCNDGDVANNEYSSWVFLSNGGSKPSKVTFSLVSPFADSNPAKNKLNVTYLDSPVELDKDVVPTTPHAGDIAWLKSQGISKGYADGTFGGMRTVVRQDMAAFLYRLAGSPKYTPSAADKARFKDVNDKTPHAKEIWWLASTGIAKGYADGTFGGMRTVVRQDMAAFLARYAKRFPSKEPSGAAKSFRDVNGKTPHASEIAWLSKTGVTQGYADGSFGGMRDVVRQDMAAFLHRMSLNVLK